MVGFLTLVLRHRRLVLGWPAALAVAAVAAAVMVGPRYTSVASFIPETADPRESRLAGLAAQFGVNLGAAAGDQSVDFYADLLHSRQVLTEAAHSSYVFEREPGDTLRGTIMDLIGAGGETPEERTRAAIGWLDERIAVRIDLAARLVIVEVTAPWAQLAEQVNRRLLDLINVFNLERRQSRAAAERRFVEERLQVAQRELEEAEGILERFLQDNRSYRDSPRLVFEAERLQRRVQLRQQVHTTLAQAYEQARVDEVRNTPVVTVVDAPEGSVRAERRLLTSFVLGGGLGLAGALALLLFRSFVARERARRAADYAELERMGRGLLTRLMPWRARGSVPASSSSAVTDRR